MSIIDNCANSILIMYNVHDSSIIDKSPAPLVELSHPFCLKKTVLSIIEELCLAYSLNYLHIVQSNSQEDVFGFSEFNNSDNLP